MSTATLEPTLEHLEQELGALALECEFEDCSSDHGQPAVWLISVRHATTTCEAGSLAICSACEHDLRANAGSLCYCQRCRTMLPYRVAGWWARIRPIG